jgi:hypothetical protein
MDLWPWAGYLLRTEWFLREFSAFFIYFFLYVVNEVIIVFNDN